jgi:hypothetical protein
MIYKIRDRHSVIRMLSIFGIVRLMVTTTRYQGRHIEFILQVGVLKFRFGFTMMD